MPTKHILSVELFHRIIKADADGGKTHLALKAGSEAAVPAGDSLSTHDGRQRSKNAAIKGLRAVCQG